MRRWLVPVVLSGLIAMSCGSQDEADEAVGASPDPMPSPQLTSTRDPGIVTPVPSGGQTLEEPKPGPPVEDQTPMPSDLPADSPYVEAARADLAARLGVAQSDITVLLTEEVTWRDGSLGCPRPGMSYTQALVPGYRIVLGHGGGSYYYHGANNRDPFYCDKPDPDGGFGGD